LLTLNVLQIGEYTSRAGFLNLGCWN